MTRYLSLEDLLILTEDLGVGPVRDVGLLDSAAHRPQATILGQEAYQGLDLKAAALLESLVRNHALVDGNRRLGWLALVVFCGLNGEQVDVPDEPAYQLVIGVADGSMDYLAVAEMLVTWRRRAWVIAMTREPTNPADPRTGVSEPRPEARDS